MDRNTEEGKVMQEREWLDHAFAAHRNWHVCPWTSRQYIYHHGQLVIYEMCQGKPQILDVVRVSNVEISWDSGISVYLDSARGKDPFRVSSHPREIVPGIFLWLPAFADVRHAPMNYQDPSSRRRMTLPLCIKAKERDLVNGARYIAPLKTFQKTWSSVL